MEFSARLKSYYQLPSSHACKLILDGRFVDQLLESKHLVQFVRYIQNIMQQDVIFVTKTLLLCIRIAHKQPKKLKTLFPFPSLSLDKLNYDSLATKEGEQLKTVINKASGYLSHLLFDGGFSLQRDLQVATSNMFSLLLVCNYPCERVEALADTLYWLVEERLVQEWHELNSCFSRIDYLEHEQFAQFYERFELFCTFKRKIPAIKHSVLKHSTISAEMNRRIETRIKEIRNPLKEQSMQEELQEESQASVGMVRIKHTDLVLTNFEGMESSEEDTE